MKTTEQQIKVRACQIENIKNPELVKEIRKNIGG
jgi:hypothetical protein